MDRPIVTTEEAVAAPPKRVLLSPRPTPARTGRYFQRIYDYTMVQSVTKSIYYSDYLGIDFETKGGDYSESIEIVGIGLAWSRGSCYFEWGGLSQRNRRELADAILGHPGLLAHNVYFDGGVTRTQFGEHARWEACTLALYMMLSNEGWAGQSWGLKSAMTDILQWENSNETELDEWLICNGYYKGNTRTNNSPEYLLARARDGSLSPEKGEMWRAPTEILGKYCILDAEACYLLYTEHLLPAANRFPEFHYWFRDRWMTHIRMHIDQKLVGIEVDRDGLLAREAHLRDLISSGEQAIREHPEIAPHAASIELGLLQELLDKEPPQYNKQKQRPPEPPTHTKQGVPSKAHAKWVENAPKYERQQSKSWEAWSRRYDAALLGENPEYRFNLRSGPQLTRLFYEMQGHPVRVLTDKGAPATGIKALKHMGEVGKQFIDLAWNEKELSYITDYLHRTQHRSSIHPSFRLPGTKTGRLSSKGPNLQQVPKSKAVMSLFRARPGHVWVDLDFSALEPMVSTEFSRDENMMLIYADGRPPNDIYLFVGAHIPGMGDAIRAAGYDPAMPTKEGISAAKKLCKHERSICKTVTLACQYGAGVNKIMQTLENDDVFLERSEVETIHAGYWDLFADVRKFGWELQRRWKRDGYVLNGLGRPMCLTEDYKHDVLNRFIQSTGHDILVEYCWYLQQLLTANGVQWSPVVWDWHDAVTIEVPEGQQEKAVSVFEEAMRVLNGQLGWGITLKGTPTVGYNLSEVKEPEE